MMSPNGQLPNGHLPHPLPIAVLGAGLIGVRHIQHILDEPRTELVAIVDPTPTGKKIADERKVPYFENLDNLIATRNRGEVRVSGAIVGTPNHTHVPLGIQLVKAGIHALVEKPVSTTIESGRELIAAGRESGSKILVGHHRRFNPHIRALKSILDRGDLGDVLAINGTWSLLKPDEYFQPPMEWHADPKSGGTILINLVHDIDLIRYLCGDIVRVYCAKGRTIRGNPVEETGAVVLHFASGAVGTFIFSDAVVSPYNFESATGENPMIPASHQNVYQLLGTKGSTSFPENRRWYYPSTQSWLEPLKQDPPEPIEDIPPFTVQLRHFADVIEEKAEPNCSGLEAVKDLIVLEAIRESMNTGKAVDVPQE